MTNETSQHQKVAGPSPVAHENARMIDRWFPCAAVDKAVGTPAGSGLSEKALFTWFASRPIAQARAAVLTTLLPDDNSLQADVQKAVELGSPDALVRLGQAIDQQYPDGRPIVLDVFSGRGIIPLEAARLGITAVGTDLSPVATLAGRLLADYPLRNWSGEPEVRLNSDAWEDKKLFEDSNNEPRLLRDVRTVLESVRRRALEAVKDLYPCTPDGRRPWAYLWAVTIPCDNCKRHFPLLGSLVLRHPYQRTSDPGQALQIVIEGDNWHVEVTEGTPEQHPPFTSAAGRRGKSARCIFCQHTHSLETVKAKGIHGDYKDALVAVADNGEGTRKTWRTPSPEEVESISASESAEMPTFGTFLGIPDEPIPEGNNDTVRASAYGYRLYGDLMNRRQSLQTAAIVSAIRSVHTDLVRLQLSKDYADALAAYAAAMLVRKLRYSTRGASLQLKGNADGTGQNRIMVNHIFADQSKVAHSHDYVEAGPGAGPGTWQSVCSSGISALKKIISESPRGLPARMRRASAISLPFRDASVDAVITDPPYYNMIDYADASDLFHVWLKRCLFDIFPDLFGGEGLQDKSEEIVVKRGNAPGEHRTRDFYEHMLSKSFSEAKRVLRGDGHLVVVFGHSDPEAWLRLLNALHDAGFVVTSAWPSRTESANTGVASIKVTVTIGCRVAPPQRVVATASQVDREVSQAVKDACRGWDNDGLALTDQLMAAYGPAMSVYGRYSQVLKPDGTFAALDRYLTLARTAVRDATALRLDEIPLETFDAPTRFAVFWQRLYDRTDVPKGEARFLAQADHLRLEDLRGSLLTETKSGFRLRLDAPEAVSPRSSTFEVARAMGAAWDTGGTEAAAKVMAHSNREPGDAQLWAVIGGIVAQLPASDTVAKALTAIQRNAGTIGNLVRSVEVGEHQYEQLTLVDLLEGITS